MVLIGSVLQEKIHLDLFTKRKKCRSRLANNISQLDFVGFFPYTSSGVLS